MAHDEDDEERCQGEKRVEGQLFEDLPHGIRGKGTAAFEGQPAAEQVEHPLPRPVAQNVQRRDAGHQRDEGGQLAGMGNLTFFTGLLQASR